ncbi:MAG: hypothetical protein ACRD99_00860, partial [Nitrososphaera sp.]
MKSSHVLLVIGGTLLVVGLVISGISVFAVTKQVLSGGSIIEPIPLEPGAGLAEVLKDVPAGRQLLLSLDSQPHEVSLSAIMTEADGDPIGIYNITLTPFTSTALTKEQGDHTLEIRNSGNGSVTISGALLNSPVVEEGGGLSADNDPGYQTIVAYGIGVLVGIVL